MKQNLRERAKAAYRDRQVELEQQRQELLHEAQRGAAYRWKSVLGETNPVEWQWTGTGPRTSLTVHLEGLTLTQSPDRDRGFNQYCLYLHHDPNFEKQAGKIHNLIQLGAAIERMENASTPKSRSA